MISSQQFVIGWIEYAAAGAILLAATKMIVDRMRQPVDRVNLIAMSLVVSAFVPLVLSFMSAPSLRLGLVSTDGEQISSDQAKNRSPIPRQLRETPDAVVLRTSQAAQASAPTTEQNAAQNQATANSTPADTASTATVSSELSPSPATAPTTDQFNGWTIVAAILLLSHSLAIAWFILQWIIGAVRLRNISRKALTPDETLINVWQQVSAGQDDSVRLLVTTNITAPMVFGWRRPTVLIPESITTGDRSSLQFCLTHEWSHVNCGDLPRWQLTNLCQFLFWYQPLFWVLRWELRICQDLVADDLAARATDDQLGRIEYSELLMSIAKQAMGPRIAGGMAFYDRSSQLSRRIKALLTNGQSLHSRSTGAFYWMSGLLFLTAALLVGSIRLSAAHADEGAPDKPAAAQTDDAHQSENGEVQAANEGQMKIVRGRVVNEAGEPVAGAQLWLPLQYQPRRTAQATADETGNFELKCPADWISPLFVGSSWTVWAYAPGHSIQSQNVYEVIRGKGEEDFAIQLPPESNTRFKVLAPNGQPLANVLVQPQNYKTSVGYELVPDDMRSVVSARTDENGVMTLPGIQSDPLFMLEIVSEEFGRQTIRVDGNSDVAGREIRLQAIASIAGNLVNENPELVRGVKMTFTTDNRDERTDPQGVAEVVTDADGHFEVPLIGSGGPLRTYLSLDPKLPVRPLLKDDLYLTPGETMQLEIPLVDAPLVHGKVVAKSTGKPVPNAEISLGYGGFWQSDMVTTDENGQYSGRALPGPVRIHIIALPDGYVQLGAPWADAYQVPADVDEFELSTIEVVGSHDIAGQLVDTNDQPLPDVHVAAVEKSRVYGGGITDSEGKFTFRVPDGVDTRVIVQLVGRPSEPVTVILKDPLVVRYTADVREQEMEAKRSLKPEVALTGRVLSSGKPIAGVSVLLKRGVSVFEASPEPTGTRYDRVSETLTDANGEYRLTGLNAGDGYAIEIKPLFLAADPTWHYQSPYVQNLPDDAQKEVALPDVNLLKLTQAIAGVVVDPDGKPVNGATVSAQLRSGGSLARMTQSGPPPWTESDHQGRFQLKELPDTPLSIMAYIANPEGGPIRFPAKLNVELDQQDVRIVLDPSLQEQEKQ